MRALSSFQMETDSTIRATHSLQKEGALPRTQRLQLPPNIIAQLWGMKVVPQTWC